MAMQMLLEAPDIPSLSPSARRQQMPHCRPALRKSKDCYQVRFTMINL